MTGSRTVGRPRKADAKRVSVRVRITEAQEAALIKKYGTVTRGIRELIDMNVEVPAHGQTQRG